MKIINEVEGAGGGKGGGSSTPKEAPNTLQSRATAKFVDLICEGPIKGLVDGTKSVIFDKVAAVNPDGSENFDGFKFAFLPGTSDQPSLPGFDGISSEFEVGRRVRLDTPVVYVTNGAALDAIVATVNIPALTKQDKKTGDLNGYSVGIAIDVRNMSNEANQYITVFNETIRGKNTSAYERSYRINVDGTGPWQVRMRRTTPDNDSDVTISDKTFFSHVSEVIEHKIAYSDSAIIGVEIDAEQFGTNIPSREYDMDLMLIEYPSNYNPLTRQYTGFWDGTFSFGWCNNPAWVFRTVANNPRWGADIDPAYIDKWYLYQLAQHCDEQVPDGFGNTEPRFTFNGLIRNQDDAYKVLQSVASMMRAIVFYGAGAVLVRQDRPMSAQRNLYTKANIIGEFNYGGTALRVRHNAAVVQWYNPALGYDTDYTSYEDRPAIIKYGYNPLSLQAIGTTSVGQAYRQGKWAVLTEQLQTETVTFTAGKDSADVLPGDVIEIADAQWATADFAGRLLAQSTDNVITSPIGSWTAAGGTASATEFKPGPWGDRNLRKLTATGNDTRMSLTQTTTNGTTYTVCIFASRKDHRYAWLSCIGVAAASFDLQEGTVRRKSPGVVSASIEIYEGDDLARICITFVANATSTTVQCGLDSTTSAVSNKTDALGTRSLTSGLACYFGAVTLNTGATAMVAKPKFTSTTTQVMLDRDIDFTGATAPEIHLMLLDGSYDDVPNVDNSQRPARRKVTYFSSAVTSYDPYTQIATLTTPIAAGRHDQETPIVWVFSKTQLKPRKWKVISIKENDKKQYDIAAVNYSDEKFLQMDENYIITNPDGNFSNLPSTTYCAPPTDIKAIYTTTRKGAILSASANIGWSPSPDKFLRGYLFSYRRNNDNWITLPITTNTNIDLTDLSVGNYEFSVKAVSRFGTTSKNISVIIDIGEVASGRMLISNVRTDRNDLTFTDKVINLKWDAAPLSANARTSQIQLTTVRPNGGNLSLFTVDVSDIDAPTITANGPFFENDQIVIKIGTSEFYYEVPASPTTATVAEGVRLKIVADARFTAGRSANVITMGFNPLALNAEDTSAVYDPMFKSFKVTVINPTTMAVVRTENVTTAAYTYTYEMNVADMGGEGSRNVLFNLQVEDIDGNLSTAVSATITNPVPTAPPVTFKTAPGLFSLDFIPPTDPDYAGVAVWIGNAGFTPGPSNLVYKERGMPTLPSPGGYSVWVRYAFYDAFGMLGVPISAEYQVDVPAVGGGSVDFVQPDPPTLGATPLTSVISIDAVTGEPITTMTFTWIEPTTNLDMLANYSIEFKEGAGNWVGGWSVPKGTNTISITTKANVSYQARVRSVGPVGATSAFVTASAYTTVKDTTPPAVPTSMSAIASIGNVFLSWIAPSDVDVDTIEVYSNTTNNSGTATLLTVVNAAAAQAGGYTHSGIATNVARYYWTKAVDTSGNKSAFSASATATTRSLAETDFTPTASAIAPIVIATGSLPATGNYEGRVSTFGGKLYRYTSGAWTASTAAADISGTLTDAQLAAIDAAKVTGQIVGTQITDGAIATAKLAAGAVTAAQIAANTITAAQIAAATITGTQIAANTITAANIAADTITAAQIAAGAISADELSAGAVTANKIAISNFDNILPFTTYPAIIGAYTYGSTGYSVTPYSGTEGQGILITKTSGTGETGIRQDGWMLAPDSGVVSVIPGEVLRVKCTAILKTNTTAVNSGNTGFYATMLDKDGVSTGGHISGVVGSSALVYNVPYEINGTYTVPAGVYGLRFQVYYGSSVSTANTAVAVTNMSIRRMNGGELIVDGSITAAHIVAGTITADKIAAGTLTGDRFNSTTTLPATLKIGTTGFDLSVASTLATGQTDLVNLNPVFSAWTEGAALPDRWSNWSTATRTKAVGMTYPNGIMISCPASTEGGISSGGSNAPWSIKPNDWIVIEAEVLLNTGNFQSAGILVRGDGTGDMKLSLATDPDITGAVIGNGVVGTVYKFSKLVKAPAGSYTPTIYVMNHWSGHGTVPATLNNITWYRAGWRPASAAEIDPAGQINDNTTTIDPGKILISGATTLSNWRNGTDNTKIEGGSIAANTIAANKLTIGNRGLSITNLDFTANWNGSVTTTNTVYWDAGTIAYINDAGTPVTVSIAAGSVAWTTGVRYIYWVQGATTLTTTTTLATAMASNNVIMATYAGGTNLVANYGGTIVDGSKITTGTIAANKLIAGSITATQIAAGTITADKIASGTIFTQVLYIGNGNIKLDGPNARIIISD